MLTIPQAFNQLLNQIEPAEAIRTPLDIHANRLRSAISSKLGKGATRHFVGGSYGRRTDLHPIKDIDIFFQMNTQIFSIQGEHDKPAQVLERLRKEVQLACKAGPPELVNAQTRVQGHSVGVHIPGVEAWFDVVPLFPHPSESGKWWLPDVERKGMIYSDPELQHSLLKQSAGRMGGNLNRYIRLIKRWNLMQGKPFRSFYLEVMCYDALPLQPSSFADGMRQTAAHLGRKVLARQPNPAGLGPYIDEMWTPEQRQAHQRLFVELEGLIGQAISLDQQKKPEQAHRIWRRVFGDVYKSE